MRFLIMGPPCAEVDGDMVGYFKGHQAVLLAELLAADSRPVSGERLVEELYGDTPLREPLRALHAHVARLRRRLQQWEPNGLGGARLVTSPPGYAFETAAHETDAGEFLATLADGRRCSDPHRAISVLGKALRLWRGPVLEGVAVGQGGGQLATSLERCRLEAAELLGAARIQAGQYAEAADELRLLLREQPCDERFAGLLIDALTRLGREREAMAVYQDLRRATRAELGVEPCVELSRKFSEIRESLGRSVQGPSRAGTAASPRSNGSAGLFEGPTPPSGDAWKEILADPGTFSEFSTFPVASDHPSSGAVKPTGSELVTGVCHVDGRAVVVAADTLMTSPAYSVQDLTGLLRALVYASAARLPFVFVRSSKRLLRGDDCAVALDRYGAIMRAAAQLKGRAPRVVVLPDRQSPALMDWETFGDAVVSAYPPTLAEGSAMSVWIAACDGADAYAKARRLVAHHASRRADGRHPRGGSAASEPRPPRSTARRIDIAEAIGSVIDSGSRFDLMVGCGTSLVTALARLEGRPVGVIANNSRVRNGVLTRQASQKGARMVRLCSAWGIPLLVLVDAPPESVSESGDYVGRAPRGSQLLHAFMGAQVPRVTVIVGQAGGWSQIVMNSKVTGAAAVYAWPGAQMAPEVAIDGVIDPGETANLVGPLLAAGDGPRMVQGQFTVQG